MQDHLLNRHLTLQDQYLNSSLLACSHFHHPIQIPNLLNWEDSPKVCSKFSNLPELTTVANYCHCMWGCQCIFICNWVILISIWFHFSLFLSPTFLFIFAVVIGNHCCLQLIQDCGIQPWILCSQVIWTDVDYCMLPLSGIIFFFVVDVLSISPSNDFPNQLELGWISRSLSFQEHCNLDNKLSILI